MDDVQKVKEVFIPLLLETQHQRERGVSVNSLDVRRYVKNSRSTRYYTSFSREQRSYVNKLNLYLLEKTARNTRGLGIDGFIAAHKNILSSKDLLLQYFTHLINDIRLNEPGLLYVFDAVIVMGGYQGIMSLMEEMSNMSEELTSDKFTNRFAMDSDGIEQVVSCPFERSSLDIVNSLDESNQLELSYGDIIDIVDHISSELECSKAMLEENL